jgi:hypothetical protein
MVEKTKATWTSLKNEGEIRCSERVSSSCCISGTCLFTHDKNPVEVVFFCPLIAHIHSRQVESVHSGQVESIHIEQVDSVLSGQVESANSQSQ